MSAKRFKPCQTLDGVWMKAASDGDWVLYSFYEALLEKRAMLEHDLDVLRVENTKLKSQLEELECNSRTAAI